MRDQAGRKHAHARGIAEPEIVASTAPSTAARWGALGDARARHRRPASGRSAGIPRRSRATTPSALRAAVGERTAAVMLEPIQGETGVYPIRDESVAARARPATRAGALLVFDEIQTGMGRTGLALGL